MQYPSLKHLRQAFTLSEILIVLGVMGLLTTLIVPSFLENQTRNTCSYAVKSSILATNSLLEDAFSFTRTNLMDEAVERLTTIRNCGGSESSATAGGCWNTTSQGTLPSRIADQGVLLKNNAVIVGFKLSVLPTDELLYFVIDANGTAGPNSTKLDQINLVTCTTTAFCRSNATMTALANQGYKVEPGQLLPADTDAVAIYERIFRRT